MCTIRRFNLKFKGCNKQHGSFWFEYRFFCKTKPCLNTECQDFKVGKVLLGSCECDPTEFQGKDVMIEWFKQLAERGIDTDILRSKLQSSDKKVQEIESVLAGVKAREENYLMVYEKNHRAQMEAREPQSCCTIL